MKRQAALLSLMVALTLAVYARDLPKGFADWDLRAYQTVINATNPIAMSKRLFTDFQGRIVPGYYAPISSISLMLDKYLVASTVPSPPVTAFVNLAIHCINGILLFALLRSFGARVAFSGIAVFVFLLHPVQVAGVMWFAQRKTVLGGMLCLLSWLSFMTFRRRGSHFYYLSSLLAYELSLLAKPAYVFFPVVLLASEIVLPKDSGLCPVTNSTGEKGDDVIAWLSQVLRRPHVFLELTPYLVLSMGSALLAMGTEHTETVLLPWTERPFVVAAAFWFYVGKILAPLNLTALYPRWQIHISWLSWWIYLFALAAAGALVARFRRRIGRRALWGLVVLLAPLIPAIGIFKFGYQVHSFVASHFLYFSMIGAGCILALAAERCLAVLGTPLKQAFVLLGLGYLAFFVIQTGNRVQVWNNTYTLWHDNLRHNPASVRAHLVLGELEIDRGHLQQAENYFLQALKLDPRNAVAHSNLGLIRKVQGNYSQAEQLYRRALAESPRMIEALNNLARLLDATGRAPEAIDLYRAALEQRPDLPPVLMNLADALVRSNRIEEGIAVYSRLVKIGAGSAEVHNNLGVLYLMTGQPEEGIRHFRAALAIDSKFSDAWTNLTNALKETAGNKSRQVHQ
jgi:tetratricopeptide (TPR) repeat protein